MQCEKLGRMGEYWHLAEAEHTFTVPPSIDHQPDPNSPSSFFLLPGPGVDGGGSAPPLYAFVPVPSWSICTPWGVARIANIHDA